MYIQNWHTNVDTDVQPTSAPFTEQPGPDVCESPENCFSLFFNDNLLQHIVNQTNIYAQKKIAAMQVETFQYTLDTLIL